MSVRCLFSRRGNRSIKNDRERKQDFKEAVATYREMVSAYTQFGYDLLEVPMVSVRERAEFILKNLKP